MVETAGKWQNPQQVPWEWTLTTAPRKRKFKRAKPRNLISTLGPLLQKNHHWEWFMHPNVHLQWDLQMPRDRHEKRSIHRWNLKEMWYVYTMGYFSDSKNCHWNYEIRPTVSTEWTLEHHTLSEATNGQRNRQMMSLLGKNNRGTGEVMCNTKRESDILTQRIPPKKINKRKLPGMS